MAFIQFGRQMEPGLHFLVLDGLFVMKVDENKTSNVEKQSNIPTQKVGLDPENLVSPPRWSPDGEWLVYHLCITEFLLLGGKNTHLQNSSIRWFSSSIVYRGPIPYLEDIY